MAPGGHDERGLFGNTHGHQGHDYTQSGMATNQAEKKKDGHSTAMLAAAGIGGIAAGAWIGHEMTENSDDEKSAAPAAAAAAPAAAAGGAAAYGAPPADPYAQDPYASQDPYGNHPAFEEPPPVPTHDADGDSISSSDRESLEEKRQELIEAQEEYQEELEEAYDD